MSEHEGDLQLSDSSIKLAMVLLMAMIAYGSLYPFAFHAVSGGIGPVHTLLDKWDRMPGRGDFISNILLYMPLGFAGAVSIGKRASLGRMGVTILIGAALSLTMEVVQYYDTGRDTEATDLYANTLGTTLGAFLGWFFGQDLQWPLRRELTANRVPALLLAAWLGYRLYPYVPTINMHKYWAALKPVFVHPQLTGYGLFRQTAFWLAIRALIQPIGGERAGFLFLRYAGFLLFSSILVITTFVPLNQVAGLGLAALIWKLFSPWPRAPVVIAAIFMVTTIVAFRLAPFNFAEIPGRYGWLPFYSFMQGSIDTDVEAAFEKFFLYGNTIWLLVQMGTSVRFATALVTAILLVTSYLEIYMPGRSAEITDAVMALIIGVFINSVESGLPSRLRFGTRSADTISRRIKPPDPDDKLDGPGSGPVRPVLAQ